MGTDETLGKGLPVEVRRQTLEALQEVEGTLGGLRKDLDKAERRAAKAHRQAIATTIVAIVGIGLAIGSLLAWHSFLQTRHSQQVASCRQFNVQQEDSRKGAVEVALTVAAAALHVDRNHLTPEQQAVADDFRRQATAEAVKQFAYRDCTDEGIRRYFSHPPDDPNRAPH